MKRTNYTWQRAIAHELNHEFIDFLSTRATFSDSNEEITLVSLCFFGAEKTSYLMSGRGDAAETGNGSASRSADRRCGAKRGAMIAARCGEHHTRSHVSLAQAKHDSVEWTYLPLSFRR